MWCVTPKLLDDGTTNNSQAAQCCVKIFSSELATSPVHTGLKPRD